jgi:predicted nucleotidyltransferase
VNWAVSQLRTIPAAQRNPLIEQVKHILEGRPEILLAVLHGSFLAGGPFHDVDLALSLDPAAIGREAFRDYELEQGVHWSAELGVPIDVHVLNDAPVAFRYHALKGRFVMVRDDEFADELRAKTWDEYCDFAPFARRYLQEAIGE